MTCSYCSRIFKEPIDLPGGDSICRQHLFEGDIVKVNRIKCKKCNGEFGVKNNEFYSNKTLKNFIEGQSYLSEDEMSLKKKFEESIGKFCEFYDQIVFNKNKIESDIFDQFQEIRFEIDEQREELKKIIDYIALAMIDESKRSENVYLKELKEKFSSFDHLQSVYTG